MITQVSDFKLKALNSEFGYAFIRDEDRRLREVVDTLGIVIKQVKNLYIYRLVPPVRGEKIIKYRLLKESK